MLYSPAVNMPAAEPKVVVAHREDLWWLLAEACQLEHMIMCQYLFAEWTLKDKSDGLTDEQSARIEGWRGVLRGIGTYDSDVVRGAGETAASLADKLAAHVPAELRSR